jgi:riboflavin synthase
LFTGLIEAVGEVQEARPAGAELDLAVDLGGLAVRPSPGDSIALAGCCCTVTRLAGTIGWFRLSEETLRRTWLGSAGPGRRLNLEDAVRAGEPLGGHFVQGHVDGVGEVVRPVGAGGGEWVVRVPGPLLRYCVAKGSIALDGVSLTIAALRGPELTIAIIPHTAVATTIGGLPAGAALNVEADVLAKHVERLLAEGAHRASRGGGAGSAGAG